METDAKIISAFKKFSRHAPLESNYRLATVDEVDQLLRDKGSAFYKESNVVLNLFPSKNEAFSLKDGYLFDFGAIRTFYPDIESNFSLTYKLGVSRDFPEVQEGTKLCLPLALLHACAEEDEEEIRDLVLVQSGRAIFGHGLKGGAPRFSLNRGFIVMENADAIQKALMDPVTNSWGLLGGRRRASTEGEGADCIAKDEGAEANIAQAGTLQDQQQLPERGYWPQERQYYTFSAQRARLALLRTRINWSNGLSSPMHFAAATRRTKVVKLLLELEQKAIHQISMSTASSSLQTAAAPQYLALFSKDSYGNTPLCSAAAAPEDNSDVVNLLLHQDYVMIHHSDLLHCENYLGMTALLIAASTGHMGTFRSLLQAHSSLYQLKSVPIFEMTTLSGPPFFESLEGNSFMHYCVDRADIHEFNEILGLLPSNWHGIARLMLRFPNHLGVTPFEVALKKGCSDICKLVLEKMCKLITEGETQIGETGVEFMINRCERDGDGNNILHLYAFGGGSKEVGELLTQWVQLLASKAQDRHLKVDQTGRDVDKDLYMGLNTMEAMMKQLNCAGETPYITALNKGHSDALQVLMSSWTEELASQYLNPETWDTVLHCYAKMSAVTPSFDHSFFTQHATGYLKKLINTPNKQGHTPIMSSFYSGRTNYLAWLLKQENVQILPEDHALHVYAHYCDDEEVGKALLAKLGHDKVQSMINESILLTIPAAPEDQLRIKGTPLMLAIAQGNLKTCSALLGVDGIELSFESMDDHQNNVLHVLCKNKTADIDQFWQKLAPKLIGKSDFTEHLINARNSDADTPLRIALRYGNTKACEWLLETQTNLQVFIDQQLDARAVFDHFKEGACCMDLALWKKLKKTYCIDQTQFRYANEALKKSLLNAFSSNGEDSMVHFMELEDVKTILDEKDTSFWLAYLEHVSRLRSLKALIEMRRQIHWSLLLQLDEILHVVAKQGNIVLLDMVLQARGYECLEEEFTKDKYQTLLKCVLCSSNPTGLLDFLTTKFSMENCTSLVFSWQGFLKLMGGQYDAVEAWIWALYFLCPYTQQNTTHAASLVDAEKQRRIFTEQKPHFENVLRVLAGRNLQNDVFRRDDRGCNIRTLLSWVRSSSLIANFQEPVFLEQLLVSIATDIPELVSLLLILFSHFSLSGGFFDTMMINVIANYARRMLLQNMHAAMHFVFTNVHKTTSQRKAFLTKPIDPIMHRFPLLQATAGVDQGSSMGTFIKVLNFAQSCRAEGVVDHKFGFTALHCACALERDNIFFTLMCMCPHLVDVVASRGRTPLMFAAKLGSSRMVEYLLQLTKRDLSFERDADGKTPLHYAAQSNHPSADKVVELLLNHARQNGDDALLLWAMAGHAFGTADTIAVRPSVIELLQKQMEIVNLSHFDLLNIGFSKKNTTMVRDLINRGVDISTIDPEYFSDLGLYETKQLDQPTIKDSLGRASLAKGIASLFLNPFAAVPITVGVLGAWGMGKSSIMLQTEIILMMTIIKRNLLSSKEDFPIAIQDKIITREVEKLQHDVLKSVEDLTQPKFTRRASLLKVFCTKWLSPPQKNNETKEKIEDFVSTYKPQCMPLYKGLALMNRHKLFQCPHFEKHHQASFSLEIPSCLTIYYNAWLYHGENDASSGLALTIMKELEGCMNTSQWLKLCWNYAYRLDPIFVFGNITLPLIVLVVMGGWIVWIIWKLFSLPSIASQEGLSNFKYGSIPVSTVVIAWIILRNIINVLKPVSEQILRSLNTSQKYEERLGYQQKIINDIEFFKEHLEEVIEFRWKLLGQIWSLVVENKDNIPKSNIKKVPISKNKLRIVVFIDDLDRCTKPTYVVELLGATNLILSACAINVVIGMDKEMIKEFINNEYKGNIEKTEKFLEKIIHVPIDLYEPSEEELSRFLEEQLIGKSKKKESTSSFYNQESLTKLHGQKKITSQITSAGPYSISQNETNSNSRKTQHLQGHVALDLREPSISNLGSQNEERKASIQETQSSNEGSTLAIHNMQEERQKTCESTSSRGNVLYDQSTLSTPQGQHQSRIKQEGNNKENNQLVVEFPLLVANYNESEVRVLKELQKKAKAEQKQPRNWKRLLSYHQLVRSIISQSKIERLSHVSGWQEQLIIWLFVCYNWKEQMNQIFKNWGKLVQILELPSFMPEPPSLHNIVLLQKQRFVQHEITSRGPNKMSEENERALEEWNDLENTLCGGYDVDMWSVDIFQKYRFHCNVGHLYW